ncbi:hypothetical protein D3C81_1453830 [compost metagenome]
MLLKEFLPFLRVLGLTDFLHLGLHLLEVFLRLSHLFVELSNIRSLLLRLGRRAFGWGWVCRQRPCG